MGDNISKQAVLEWLKTEWDGMVTSVFDGIEQLPSTDRTIIRAKALMTEKDFEHWAENIKKQDENIVCIPCDAEVYEPIGRWIPCSERLPKKSGDYIITVEWDEEDGSLLTAVDTCEYKSSNKHWCYFGDVTAWMPLPEAYKEGE